MSSGLLRHCSTRAQFRFICSSGRAEGPGLRICHPFAFFADELVCQNSPRSMRELKVGNDQNMASSTEACDDTGLNTQSVVK
jgi:hypothetical protein